MHMLVTVFRMQCGDDDDGSSLNDPGWRDVLYEKRAKRRQSAAFIEWAAKHRAASMIQVHGSQQHVS